MAPLSNLSIGFIVGGAVISAAIITGFIIWKVIDVKRRTKSHRSAHHEASTGCANISTNGDLINQRQSAGNSRTESIYAEIIYDDDNQSVTIIDDPVSYSTVVKRKTTPTDESKDDSGYDGSHFVANESEQYATLHEISNHIENVYGELSCYGSSQSPMFTFDNNSSNPVSYKVSDYEEAVSPFKAGTHSPDKSPMFTFDNNSSNPISYKESNYLEATSPFKAVSNERDQDNLDITPATSGRIKDMDKDVTVQLQPNEIIKLDRLAFPPAAVVVLNHDDEDTDDSDEGSLNKTDSQNTSL